MAAIKAVSRKRLYSCVAAISAATLLSIVGVIISGRLDRPTVVLKKHSQDFIPKFVNLAERHYRLRELESERNQTIHSFMTTSVGIHVPIHLNSTGTKVNVSSLMKTGPPPSRTKTPSRCNQQNCLENKDKLSSSVEFHKSIHPSTKVNFMPADTLPSTSHQCSRPNCFEFLSIKDHSAYIICLRDTTKRFGYRIQQSSCVFLRDRSRKAVALASPEGSGNTWLRVLLEKATGVCTGFCGCDPEMRVLGFPGEAITSGSVLIVKTHLVFPQWFGDKKKFQWEGSYGSAVILIRNPAKALIAEWNRRVTNRLKSKKRNGSLAGAPINSHTYAVSEEQFRNERWEGFFEFYLKQWVNRLKNWVFLNTRNPVHVVSYEDLRSDTVREMEKILDFLQFPYTHYDLVQKLTVDFNTFKRPHNSDEFQHFSPEQKEQLKQTLRTVVNSARMSGKEHLFHFNYYLESLHDIT